MTKLNLAPGYDLFGFTWGSIDPSNTLILTDSNHHVFTITGAEILSHLIGSAGPGLAQENVVFRDPFASIISAVFEAPCDPFEIANVGQGEAPLPPALAMFGAALLGFGLYGYRRRQNAAI